MRKIRLFEIDFVNFGIKPLDIRGLLFYAAIGG